MKKILLIMLALAAACGPVFARGARGPGKITVGVSLPTIMEERWVADYRGFLAAGEKLGAEVHIWVADNNAAQQRAHVEGLIASGANALIVAPCDSDASRQFIAMARDANIPIVAYDRPIPAGRNGRADLYVGLGQFEIGQLMGRHIWENVPSGNLVFLKGDPADYNVPAMAAGTLDIIQARIDDGTYRVVMDQHVMGWEPARAFGLMEQALAANGNNIQGVIAPNDGTASGVIQALEAAGLAGKVPVTGQNAEADAVRRVIDGTQGMTISYNSPALSEAALMAAIGLFIEQSASLNAIGPNAARPNAAGLNAIRPNAAGPNATDSDGTPKLSITPVLITGENYRRELIEKGLLRETDLR
jgi:D-xylose transport system substrate-binding protein